MPQYEMTRVATVTEMEGSIVRLVDETTYVSLAGPEYVYGWIYEYVYNCDADGVWLLGQTTTYVSDYGENESESQTQLELETPALIYPLEASLGSTWETVYDGHQISNGYESPYRMTYTITVIGDETVSVPYGDVQAFRLMSETNGYPYQTWYVGQELGIVQDTSWMLEDYAP
jgi:hypothetical protein